MPINNENNSANRFSRYYPSATRNHPVKPAPERIKRGPLQIKLLNYIAQNGLRLVTLADRYSIQAPSLRAWLDTDEPLPLAWIGVIGPLVGLPVADTEQSLTSETTVTQQSRTRIHVLTVPPAHQSATATPKQKKLQKPEATPTSATTAMLYRPEPSNKDEYYRQLNRQQQQQRKRNARNVEQQDLLAIADTPKPPPQPRPASHTQLDNVKVLAEKMRKQGGNPDVVVSEMSQGRPLETLTRNEVSKIIAELIRRTDGKMKALQQLQKGSQKQNKKK